VTPKQRKRIEKYTRWMANEIGLRDWTFIISRTPADEGNHAHIFVNSQRYLATIYLAADFFEDDLETQRMCILHELLHVHFNPTQQAINHLEDLLGKPAYKVAYEHHQRGLEMAIDGLATNIARHFPLPKREKAKRTD
jgi:hypothetical protein